MHTVKLSDGQIFTFTKALDAANFIIRNKKNGAELVKTSSTIAAANNIGVQTFSPPPVAPIRTPLQPLSHFKTVPQAPAPQPANDLSNAAKAMLYLDQSDVPLIEDDLVPFLMALSMQESEDVAEMIAYFAAQTGQSNKIKVFIDRVMDALVDAQIENPNWFQQIVIRLKAKRLAELNEIVANFAPFVPATILSSEYVLTQPAPMEFYIGNIETPLGNDELEYTLKEDLPQIPTSLKSILNDAVKRKDPSFFSNLFHQPTDFGRYGSSPIKTLAALMIDFAAIQTNSVMSIIQFSMKKLIKKWAEDIHRGFVIELIVELEGLSVKELAETISDFRHFADYTEESNNRKRPLEEEDSPAKRQRLEAIDDHLQTLLQTAKKVNPPVTELLLSPLSLINARPRDVAIEVAKLLESSNGVCLASVGTFQDLANDLFNLFGHDQYNSCRIKFKRVFVPGILSKFPLMRAFFDQKETPIPTEELLIEIEKQHQAGTLKFAPDLFKDLLIEAHKRNVALIGTETSVTYQLSETDLPTEEINLGLDFITHNIINGQSRGEPYIVFVHDRNANNLLTDGTRSLSAKANIPLVLMPLN